MIVIRNHNTRASDMTTISNTHISNTHISNATTVPQIDTDFEFDLEALNDFLYDPIGYGDFDHSDPITLEQFITTRHHRGCYAAPLAF
ncbi:MAG: hypothetical protein ACI8TP_000958 [Acidimicrobiales bacterium]|jgi:hypothetical protein